MTLPMKQWIKIIDCYPAKKQIQGHLRDGGQVVVSVFDVPASFRWPKQNELWSIYRDPQDQNHWLLGGRVHQEKDIENLSPGDMRLDSQFITDSDGTRVNVIFFQEDDTGDLEAVLRWPDGTTTIIGEEESNGIRTIELFGVDVGHGDPNADTAAFLAAAASGHAIRLGEATYQLNEWINWSNALLYGLGSMQSQIKLITADAGLGWGTRSAAPLIPSGFNNAGGSFRGFLINGNSIATIALYLGNIIQRLFEDIIVYGADGDNVICETGQNHTFNDCFFSLANRTNFVFDYGTGGHSFTRCEFAAGDLYNIEFRQTGPSLGGYPTFLGPSGNTFFGCIEEYATDDQVASVYHGAGTNNRFYASPISPTGQTSPGAGLIMEPAANAVAATADITNGSDAITVTGDISQVSELMTVRGPGIEPGTIIFGIVGDVIVMSASATSTSLGSAVGFGAFSSELVFDNCTFPGTSGQSVAFDLRGGCTLFLTGRTAINNHDVVFRTRASDHIYLQGPITYSSITTRWEQQSGDTATADPNLILSAEFDGLITATTYDDPHASFRAKRLGDLHPNLVTYPGSVLISDGTYDPTAFGIQYGEDTPGNHATGYTRVLGLTDTPVVRVTGFPGATTTMRFGGLYANTGHPIAGTWNTGDQITNENGEIWTCITGGTPGTWANASSITPSFIGPSTFNGTQAGGGVIGAGLADGGGYGVGSARINGMIHTCGFLVSSGSLSAGSTIFTLPAPSGASHRPGFTVITNTMGFLGGGAIPTQVGIQITTAGVISLTAALAASDLVLLDSLPPFRGA